MRISVCKRFILLHLPRTGVSSLIAALDDRLFVRAPPTLANKLMSKYVAIVPRPIEKTCFRTHETACRVRRLVRPGPFGRYRTIAFVRNPYSWLVSLYELVMQSPSHRHYDRVRAMTGFAEYVDWEIHRNKRKQHPYLLDRGGRLLADYVGRFECLADHATRIFGSVGVELKALPHIGRFTRRDYREFYDRTLRGKVEAHWARDLELFGYDFDGPADGGQTLIRLPD